MSLHCHLTVLYRHLSSQYTSHTTVTTDFGAQWTGRYLMQAILGSPLYRKSLFGPISRTTHSTLHHQSVCLSVSCLTRETRAITSDVQQVWVQECVDSLLEIHYWWFSSVRLVHRQRGGGALWTTPKSISVTQYIKQTCAKSFTRTFWSRICHILNGRNGANFI